MKILVDTHVALWLFNDYENLSQATSECEEMVILTADENIHKYDIQWLW